MENEMLSNTKAIVEKLLIKPDFSESKNILSAQRALINYLTVFSKGSKQKEVIRLYSFMNLKQCNLPFSLKNKISSERAALLNGFTAHYLDLDDTHAGLRGHPSAVIMSALFAVTNPDEDSTYDFLWAYVQGVELAGKLGKILNPKLAFQGWHTTGVIGTIAAAAAIGVYKHSDSKNLINILSFATTQTSGIEIQAGSDGKPFNAGIAARNAVTAFLFSNSGLIANQDPFNNKRGWLKVIQNIEAEPKQLTENWLKPAEIAEPGLWFKTYSFCSAAMASFDAAKELYNLGIHLSDCKKIIIHFPPQGDHALRYHNPKTGKEGKFSAEYIVWQVLALGNVQEELFEVLVIPEEFKKALVLFTRRNDLQNFDRYARPTEIEVILENGSSVRKKVVFPKGSPRNEIDIENLLYELKKQLNDEKKYKNIIDKISNL